MRVPALLAAALVLVACGSKAPDSAQPPVENTPAPVADAATPNHTINMVESTFQPATLTVKVGDVVEFKNVSGGIHNVVFDTIPAGGYAAIKAGISDAADSVSSAMLNEGQSVIVSFKDAVPGVYHFVCMPHMAQGMRGSIVVEP